MTGRIAHIVRHPVKAIGFEELEGAVLEAGRALAFDRHWAVAHEAAKFADHPEGWAAKMNFLRGVAGPDLMAIRARFDAVTGQLTLTHPHAGSVTLAPGTESGAARLIDWLRPLWPVGRPAPRNLVSRVGQAFADMPDPFLSVLSHSSSAALEARMGHTLSPHRWRGNLWVEGWEPFAEFGLIGRRLRIGPAVIEIDQRITRCRATCVNPETGEEDADTLVALQAGWGHQDFGVYARVIEGGPIALGDKVELI